MATKEPSFEFDWKKGEDIPCPITWCRTTVKGDKDTYLADYSSGIKIFQYHPETDAWTFLTEKSTTPTVVFGFAGFNDDLMLVGGRDAATNQSSSMVNNWQFTDNTPCSTRYPPMGTPRVDPVVIGWRDYLIVAGGLSDGNPFAQKQTVEIFNANKDVYAWKPAGALPVSSLHPSAVVLDDVLYISGDGDKVFRISIPSLIESDNPEWECFTNVPFRDATLFTCHNRLLSAGGIDATDSAVSDIMCWVGGDRKEWVKVGDMPQPCSMCCCVWVPQCDGVFLTAGKKNQSDSMLLKGIYRAFNPL